MNENLVTFLYELANFVVFAVLLGWIFVKPVRRMLDEQAARDAKLEESAKQHLAEAEQLRQQLLDDRQRFKQEIDHQTEAALNEARQEATRMLDQAKQEIASQREHLSHEVLQIQRSQLSEWAGIVASVAKTAVEDLLKQIKGPALTNALVESACQQLKHTNPMKVQKITVESAEELDESMRQKIAQAVGLESANGKIEFHVDPELMGGFRIRTGQGVIDNSIAALSTFAEQKIRQQLNQTH